MDAEVTNYQESPRQSPSHHHPDNFKDIEPVYEELPGWSESTVGLTSIDQLPENARAYIRFLEEQIEAPIDIISTGPDRVETIILRHPFGE